ncbi:MAG: AAA family ATPase [Victivallales bacterium]|nr:AAA family ATPase [Victivallales bacterium]
MEYNQEFKGRLIVKYPEKNLPERIRKYVTGVYQYLDSTVDNETNHRDHPIIGRYEIDGNLQNYYLLLKRVEFFLREMAKSQPLCSYFRRTMDKPTHKAAFERLIAGENDWFYELTEKAKQIRQYSDNRSSLPSNFYYFPGEEHDELLDMIMVSGKEQFEFPYFLIYCIDNGLKPLDALKGLYRDNPFVINMLQSIEESDDCVAEKYNCLNIRRLFPEWHTGNEKLQSKRWKISNPDNPQKQDTEYYFFRITKDGKEDKYPFTNDIYKFVFGASDKRYNSDYLINLFNSNLLINDNEEKKLVFVTEFIQAAQYLEKQIIDNHVAYLEKQLLDIVGGYKGELFYSIHNNIKGNEKYPVKPTYNVPAGDCIWVAPVGGYCAPWFSNWSELAGRVVYIFKVGEKNPHVYLKELVDVLDAIHQQLEESNQKEKASNQQEQDKTTTIKFVVCPTKILPNYNHEDEDNGNKIEILSVEDLFVQCKKNKIKIPETLRGYYGKIMRKRTNARADEFIVEPILRKNDWILFTGKEGSGKSFFSIALGMAIANNRKMMFSGWKLRRKSLKVLYITDTEMKDSIIKDRLAAFRHIYNTRDNGLFLYEQVKYCNLTNEDGQKKMEKTIAGYTNIGKEDEPVSVVIFDHLLKLTDAQGDEEENWKKFRTWLDKLTEEQHLSIILVHHEYAGTKMLGTRLIANDVGTRLHFEDYLGYMARELTQMPKRSKEDKKEYDDEKSKYKDLEGQTTKRHIINIGVTIVKNRGGEKDREPRYLGISMEEQSMYYDIDDVVSTQTGQEMQSSTIRKWKGMTEDEKITFLKESLDEGKTRAEMAVTVGMSIHTIGKALDIFRKEGKLPPSNRRTNKTTEKVEDTNADSQTVKTDN